MSFEGFFVAVSMVAALTSTAAVVKARAIGWLVPFYFLVSFLTSELAAWLLMMQLAFFAFALLLVGVDGGYLWIGTALFTLSWAMLLIVMRRAFDSGPAFEHALTTALGDDFRDSIPLARRRRLKHHIHSDEWLKPFHFSRPAVRVQRDIAYGDGGKRHLLDIFTPAVGAAAHTEGRPVLIQIHGGAWILGHKAEQGQPLLHRMTEMGWVGVSINYHLAPKHAWPAQIIDVKRAIAWVRANIADYGGNPEFIAVTGGSAGGHLTLLSALSANFADWQPGFEGADTRVQAAMALYPVVDFTNRHGIRRHNSLDGFIERKVIQQSLEQAPDLFADGSPIDWIHRDGVAAQAPPMALIQGTHDTLVWVEEARQFVAEFAPQTSHPLVYAEIPGAQHAFECFHSPRTSHYLNAASSYLEWCYARWRSC